MKILLYINEKIYPMKSIFLDELKQMYKDTIEGNDISDLHEELSDLHKEVGVIISTLQSEIYQLSHLQMLANERLERYPRS